MNKFTPNAVLKGLTSAGVDVNNAESIREFIVACEIREFVMSPLDTWLARSSFGQVPHSKLMKAFGKDKTIGYVLSNTKEEVRCKITAGAFAKVVNVVEEKGLSFSKGCIYCGSSKCVAYRYGESVCGPDYSSES